MLQCLLHRAKTLLPVKLYGEHLSQGVRRYPLGVYPHPFRRALYPRPNALSRDMLPCLVRRRKQPFSLRGESFSQFGGYLRNSAFIRFLRSIMYTVGLYRDAPKRNDVTHSEACFQRHPKRQPRVKIKATTERFNGFFVNIFAFQILLSQNVKFCHLLRDNRRSSAASGSSLWPRVFASDKILNIAPLSVSA